MSTIPDAGVPAGPDSQPCPISWCQLPDGHDAPAAGAVGRRGHSRLLFDDPVLGAVCAVRTDTVIEPHGPMLAGAVYVELGEMPTALTVTGYDDLVDGLVYISAWACVTPPTQGSSTRAIGSPNC